MSPHRFTANRICGTKDCSEWRKFIQGRYHSIFSSSIQFLSIFTIVTAIFDIYCLSMAAPGSVHYGYYFISYEFVYVGNRNGNWHLNRPIDSQVFMIHFFLSWPISSFSSEYLGDVCAIFIAGRNRTIPHDDSIDCRSAKGMCPLHLLQRNQLFIVQISCST